MFLEPRRLNSVLVCLRQDGINHLADASAQFFRCSAPRIFLWTLGIGKHIRKNNCVLDSVGEILAQKEKNLFH